MYRVCSHIVKSFHWYLLAALCLIPIALYASGDVNLFDVGKKAFNDGAYNFAINRFSQIVNAYPESELRAQAIYYSGVAYVQLKKKDEAQNLFHALEREYSTDPLSAMSRYYQALLLFNEGRYPACIESIEASLVKYPNNPYEGRLLILLSRTYATIGQREEAFSMLLRVKDESKADAEFEVGVLLYQAGSYDKAEIKFQEMILALGGGKFNDSPNGAELLEKSVYFKAKSVLYQNKPEEARIQMQAFLSKYPSGVYSSELRFLLAYIPFELKDYTKAIETLGGYYRTESITNYFPGSLYYLGRSFEESGQIVLAVESYNDLIARYDNNFAADAKIRIYEIYKKSGNTEQAIGILKSMVNTPHLEAKEKALRELALLSLDNEPAASQKYFEELLAEFGKGVSAFEYYKWYSYLLIQKGNIEKANLLLIKAYENFPTASGRDELLLLIGDNLLEQRSYQESLKYYTLLLNKFPDSKKVESASEGVAYIHYIEKNYTSAFEIYEQLKKSGNNEIRAIAFFFVAEIERLRGDFERATTGYKIYLLNFPNHVRATTARGRLAKLYYQNKNYKESVKRYGEMFALAEDLVDKAEALYWKGWSHFYLQEELEAAKSFQQIFDLDPSNLTTYTYESLLLSAKIYYNNKKIQEAIQSYLKLVNNASPKESEKDYQTALIELMVCYVEIKDLVQAEFYLEKIKAFPSASSDDKISAYSLLAEAYMTGANYAKASDTFGKMASLATTREKRGEFLYWKGNSELKQKKGSVAQATFQSVLAEGETSFYWDAFHEIALLKWGRGDKKGAVEDFKRIARNSNRKDLISSANSKVATYDSTEEKNVVKKTDNREDLIAAANRLKNKEAIAEAAFKIAESYKAEGNLNAAVVEYKKVTDNTTGPMAAKAQLEIVSYFFSKNDFHSAYNEGMTYFYVYSGYDITSEKALYMIGLSALKTGNEHDARQFSKKLQSLFPNSKYLKELPVR